MTPKPLKLKQLKDQEKIRKVADNWIRRCCLNLSIGKSYSPMFKGRKESADLVAAAFREAGWIVKVSENYYPYNRCSSFYFSFK